MINGDPNIFIETLYSGQEIVYRYSGGMYLLQGWCENNRITLDIQQLGRDIPNWHTWSYEADTTLECVEAFLKARIFNGKTFWEVESEIEWVEP